MYRMHCLQKFKLRQSNLKLNTQWIAIIELINIVSVFVSRKSVISGPEKFFHHFVFFFFLFWHCPIHSWIVHNLTLNLVARRIFGKSAWPCLTASRKPLTSGSIMSFNCIIYHFLLTTGSIALCIRKNSRYVCVHII